jgi:hypothetical protein
MSELRGRPYAFVILTMMCWIGARMAWPNSPDEDSRVAFPAAGPDAGLAKWLPKAALQSAELQSTTQRPLQLAAALPFKKRLPRKAPAKTHSHHLGLPPALVPRQVGGRPSGLPMPLRVAGDGKSLSPGRDTPPTIAHAPVGKAGQPFSLRPKSWQIYAYSFWRASRSGDPVLGSNAQYGGSQSGLIATLDPFGAPDQGVALLMRGSVMPVSGGSAAHELGFGLRWKPKRNWPVILTAERRFRDRSTDDFAAYAAGGVDSVSLFKGWELNAFGQAGYAKGKNAGSFFDVQARAMRPIGKLGNIPLSAGFGSWAGGQKGAHRLDIGPTIAAKFDAAPAVVLVQLDWRLRVAGNAEPKNGLALTVSTGF